MSHQYIIRMSPQNTSVGFPLQLIKPIPKRMVRLSNMEGIKRYVATQYNLAYEHIESMEPFYHQ